MRQQGDTVVNIIYDWTDTEVWEYIRGNGIKYNPMYDMGYHRVGCLLCPLARYQEKKKEMKDFPGVKERYLKAFERLIEKRKSEGKKIPIQWETAESMFDWWIGEHLRNVDGQMSLNDFMEVTE